MVPARLWRKEGLRRRLDALALGLLVALVGMASLEGGPLPRLEQGFGLQWLFHLRGPVSPPGDVVVVAIDEQTPQDRTVPGKPRWSRKTHAEIIPYLVKAGARVIVFDMTFEGTSTLEDDHAFATAMAEAGNVLVTIAVRSHAGSDGLDPVLPAPLLKEAAAGCAPFLLPKDSRVDTYWTFIGDGVHTGDTPTLPALAFHVYAADVLAKHLAASRESPSPLSAHVPARASRCPEARDHATARRALCLARGSGTMAMPAFRDAPQRAAQQEIHRLMQSLVHLHCDGDVRYLNFYGPPRTLRTVPYASVLQAAQSPSGVSPAPFADKAVFIGYAATTLGGQDRVRDDYRTVYSMPSGLDLSGVEIAATAFANLADDRPLRPLAHGSMLAVVALWGLLLGSACRLPRPSRAVVLALAMAAAFMGIVYACFVKASLWMPSVAPIAVQLPLALLLGMWLHYLATRREREAIRQAFGYFVPGAVVEQLSHDAGPMTVTSRVVFGACLSTDIENYTTFAESTSPGRLGEIMNEYYAQLFVPVERSGGVVVDVVGDAMVAVWAKGTSVVEPRAHACEAALDIVEALDRYNDAPAGHPRLPTRLGLDAGDMLLGSIGASGHFEYRAVGDIVNTASRIQGLNKALGTRLLASEATVTGLDSFATRRLGSFMLSGKTNAVSIVEVIARKHDVGAATHTRCEWFAQALAAHDAQRWQDAIDLFSTILAHAPHDGPSRFYRDRCAQLLKEPPAGAWTPTVRIDSK